MILLDTHILLWWLDGSQELSLPVNREIANHEKTNSIHLSAVSVWEVSLLVRKKKIDLQRNLDEWTQRLENLSFVKIIPVDHWIFLRSTELPSFPNKDPADRIIVATAQKLGAMLISKDDKILNYPHVKSFWRE
ncbi:MAG: type II toxin-antitoxin system VapC family toxin [Deltaproteobacteria bacterium]|nr:type II toxin-antitoxin system VapC family toxin [Deltaproteobacteria bacterium]